VARAGEAALIARALVACVWLGCSARSEPAAAPPTAPSALDTVAATPLPAAATQLVLVTAVGWDETRATLRRYEREGTGWRAVGGEVPAVLGRTGLAWGRGLHGDGAPAGRGGPVKKEGDGRSTAGVFRLGEARGREPAAPPGTKVPYARLSESWRCVDDPRSRQYNRVLDSTGIAKDWASAEDMWAVGALYDLLVVVDHNTPPVAGAGSCIFLHVWRGPERPTAGCTAMPRDALADLIAWLRPGEAFYVALPAEELADLRQSWRLP
jgi:L,D-peptidoglycan transpeptidase YkuD (ErfK/YbiS/YcfS/YnhG family)